MDRARSGVVGGRTRFLSGLVAISALAALVAIPAGPALAKRIVGTSGADRIVGTKKADRINARGGNDRVKGRAGGDRLKGAKGKDRLVGGKGGDRLKGSRGKDRIKGAKGKDRLSAGKGADRLKAVDDKRDRAVNGGRGQGRLHDRPGRSARAEELREGQGQERTGPRSRSGPGDDDLRVTSASGLTCGSSLPLCPFQIDGDSAEAASGTVSGGGGVSPAAGAGGVDHRRHLDGPGLYGCSADGYLKVTIGSKSVRVPITCTV